MNDRTEEYDAQGKVCGLLERRLRHSFKYAQFQEKKNNRIMTNISHESNAPVDHDGGIGKLLIKQV